jgi:hypothetical protein
MDKNKLVALNAVNFKVLEVCYLCDHSNIKDGSSYGTCNINEYEHLKHTSKERKASIHLCGTCDNFEFDKSKEMYLGSFCQFVKGHIMTNEEHESLEKFITELSMSNSSISHFDNSEFSRGFSSGSSQALNKILTFVRDMVKDEE